MDIIQYMRTIYIGRNISCFGGTIGSVNKKSKTKFRFTNFVLKMKKRSKYVKMGMTKISRTSTFAQVPLSYCKNIIQHIKYNIWRQLLFMKIQYGDSDFLAQYFASYRLSKGLLLKICSAYLSKIPIHT